jgi:hypothetical protein
MRLTLNSSTTRFQVTRKNLCTPCQSYAHVDGDFRRCGWLYYSLSPMGNRSSHESGRSRAKVSGYCATHSVLDMTANPHSEFRFADLRKKKRRLPTVACNKRFTDSYKANLTNGRPVAVRAGRWPAFYLWPSHLYAVLCH